MWSSFASRLVCCDYFLPSCPAQRKYSPLFQIFATFCAVVATELNTCSLIFATDHLPPDICHPGQTELAATGILFRIKWNTHVWEKQIYRNLHDRSFCEMTNSWEFCHCGVDKAIWPIALHQWVHLAFGFLFLLRVGMGLLFRAAASLHNDLIDLSTGSLPNGTPVLTNPGQAVHSGSNGLELYSTLHFVAVLVAPLYL